MKTCKTTSLKTLFALLGLLCCLLGSPTLEAQVTTNIATDELTAKSPDVAWEEGATAPNLFFNDVNNKKFKLYDLLDKPLIIEFYELNCHTCAKNKKYLKSFYKQFNINILSICPDDYPNEIRKLSRNQQLNWSTVYDDSRKLVGASFAEQNQLGNARFLLLLPDKTIAKIFYSEKAIGKLGVELQNYFN
ncbi:MAG: redoxin domain-containing protein [Bacteroidota bacterium]